MARTGLMPGMGGRVTLTKNVTEEAAAVVTDELDCSRCAQIGVQVTAGVEATAELTVQTQQSIDGTNFANLGSPVVAALGDVIRFDITDGPFGILRFQLSSTQGESSDSSASPDTDEIQLTVVGFPAQWSN